MQIYAQCRFVPLLSKQLPNFTMKSYKPIKTSSP
uniref:Uncharacterized protein n=1 Tax=Anguilla anguilla TaxID=7936 RepID=A0A0E9WGT6_ANGAN